MLMIVHYQTKVSTPNQRMGALGINMAVSLTPYDGAVMSLQILKFYLLRVYLHKKKV